MAKQIYCWISSHRFQVLLHTQWYGGRIIGFLETELEYSLVFNGRETVLERRQSGCIVGY